MNKTYILVVIESADKQDVTVRLGQTKAVDFAEARRNFILAGFKINSSLQIVCLDDIGCY